MCYNLFISISVKHDTQEFNQILCPVTTECKVVNETENKNGQSRVPNTIRQCNTTRDLCRREEQSTWNIDFVIYPLRNQKRVKTKKKCQIYLVFGTKHCIFIA